MNGPTRTRLYRFIAQRDGERCKRCGKLPDQGQLVIDHIDNNSRNNNSENLQLLCRRCNYLKNPRQPVDLSVSEEWVVEQTELQVNRLKEPMFKKYVFHRINEETSVPEVDLVNAGAEEIGASPVTTKRYLNKMCSSRGTLERARIGGTRIIRYKSDEKLT